MEGGRKGKFNQLRVHGSGCTPHATNDVRKRNETKPKMVFPTHQTIVSSVRSLGLESHSGVVGATGVGLFLCAGASEQIARKV